MLCPYKLHTILLFNTLNLWMLALDYYIPGQALRQYDE